MRRLLPDPLQDDPDLHAFYAQGWIEDGGVRVNFISSVDGAASLDGLTAGLQTPGDNRVFKVLRDLADVVVVGAGTARAEGYRAIRVSDERRAVRRQYGLAEMVPTAVVSRSLDLDPASGLFAPGPDLPRTIVITCGASDLARRAALTAVADVLVCGDDHVDLVQVRAALIERGLTRQLCEGGPRLFGDLVAAGELDELCLTVSPLLSGPAGVRVIGGESWPATGPRWLRLAGLVEEAGALFCRYRTDRP